MPRRRKSSMCASAISSTALWDASRRRNGFHWASSRVALARRGISGRRQPRLDPRLRRALAGIAVGDRRFPAGWRNAEAVEQHRQLIRDPVFGVVAAALVYRADDVPLVVRAAAERRRRFERVVIAKRGLREAVLRRLLERRIRLDSLVEELVDLRHV